MVLRLFFGYQLDRFDEWRRLSPFGKLWWAFKRGIGIVVVTTVLAVLYIGGTYRAEVQPVLDGVAPATTLVGPLVASLPVLVGLFVVAVFAVVVPVRHTDDWE